MLSARSTLEGRAWQAAAAGAARRHTELTLLFREPLPKVDQRLLQLAAELVGGVRDAVAYHPMLESLDLLLELLPLLLRIQLGEVDLEPNLVTELLQVV